jgi:hypothetical protein
MLSHYVSFLLGYLIASLVWFMGWYLEKKGNE